MTALVVTGLVGGALIITRAHWLSDVVGGGAVASAVVCAVGLASCVPLIRAPDSDRE